MGHGRVCVNDGNLVLDSPDQVTDGSHVDGIELVVLDQHCKTTAVCMSVCVRSNSPYITRKKRDTV